MTKKQEILKFIDDYIDENSHRPSAREISDEIGCDKSYAYRVLYEYEEKPETPKHDDFMHVDAPEKDPEYEKTSAKYSGNSGELTVNSFTIHTLEQALEVGNVDLEVWEVERYVLNSWGVTMTGPDKLPIYRTNYQVKVWLRRKKEFIQTAIKDLIDGIGNIRLDFSVNPRRKSGEFAAEIALYDAHFGKFSWHDETLMGNWDTEICKKAYLQGCERGLEHVVNYDPEKIFFVFGNDFMHFENVWGTTPHGGNVLDIDGRLPKVARIAMESVIEAINMCRSVAPVEVKWVPGNHDMHASYWLSLVLEAFYKNDKHVTIDNSPANKKAVLWGNLLVGWFHDASGRKLSPAVNMLPQFWPDLWGQSIYRELHVGHKHKKVQTKTLPVDTVGGTIVRQIPSLSSIDFWHGDNLFVDAVPAGEALLWSKIDGVVAHYTANIRPEVD